jgi:hypothetical protein
LRAESIETAEVRHFSSLARPMQSVLHPRDGPGKTHKTPKETPNVHHRNQQPPFRRRFLGRHVGSLFRLRDHPCQPDPDRLIIDHRSIQRTNTMFGSDLSARLASAAFAVVLTIASFAYAIVPASPGMIA